MASVLIKMIHQKHFHLRCLSSIPENEGVFLDLKQVKLFSPSYSFELI